MLSSSHQPAAVGESAALLMDFYQLTMAYGYWKAGIAERRAAFGLYFRNNPFGGGFTIACGFSAVIAHLQNFRFHDSDLTYLSDLRTTRGDRPLFDSAFIESLAKVCFTCDLDAMPEGTIAFPQEHLLTIRGPVLQGQLFETALLNAMNFQSLIATKAARIVLAAGEEPVYEFGLRRAQGFDGAMTASRAAFIGGVAGTSNLLAAKAFNIPPRGTHGHSWVMCFPSEAEAFLSYAKTFPDGCVLLVDTYNTLEGVRKAIEAGRWLANNGYRLGGLRLDSGDLAHLSIEARRLLDEAGFFDAMIVASNDLDEHIISSLKTQSARINAWGVGTKLVTGYDQPSLGCVYKLLAIQDEATGQWIPKLKLSEQAVKMSTPSLQQVRRYHDERGYCFDMIIDAVNPPLHDAVMIDPLDPTRRKLVSRTAVFEEQLIPYARGGKFVGPIPSIIEARERAKKQLSQLHPGVKRFVHPHLYPVGLEERLYHLRTRLALKQRGLSTDDGGRLNG